MGVNLSKDSDSADGNIRGRKTVVPRRRSHSISIAAQQRRRQQQQPPDSSRPRSKITNFKDKSTRTVAPVSHQILVTDNASPVSMLSTAVAVPRHRQRSFHLDTSDANSNLSSNLSRTSEDEIYGTPSSSTNSTPTSPHAWIEKALAYNNSLKAKETEPTEGEGKEQEAYKATSVFDYGDEKEYNRQLRMHYVLKRVFKGNLMITMDRPPTSILDCACGAGFWSLDMAQTYPNSRVIGMDIRQPQWLDEMQLRDTVSTPSNLSFSYGDLTKLPLPFEDNAFDLVYQRDLATVLPFKCWPGLIKELYRILCPGGVVQLVEYELFYKKTGPVLSLVNDWIVAACASTGIDPFFTRSMNDFLSNAGFEDIREHVIEIPIGEWPEDEEQRHHGFLQKELMKQAFKSMKKWWTSQFGTSNEQYDQFSLAALGEFDEYQISYTWKVYTAKKPSL